MTYDNAKPGDFFLTSNGGLFYVDADLRAIGPDCALVTGRATGLRGFIVDVLRGSQVVVAWHDEQGRAAEESTVDASTLRVEL